MLCDKCKKNTATRFIKTIVNGIAKEYNLCEECAKDAGYSSIGNGTLSSMLASLFGEGLQKSSAINETKCPKCNATFSQIAKNGKVGCSECYKTFKSDLLPYIKRIHGSISHIGKVPNRAPLIVKPSSKTVDDLRMELNRLVAEEKYEQAAIVRDEIKKMEAGNNE